MTSTVASQTIVRTIRAVAKLGVKESPLRTSTLLPRRRKNKSPLNTMITLEGSRAISTMWNKNLTGGTMSIIKQLEMLALTKAIAIALTELIIKTNNLSSSIRKQKGTHLILPKSNRNKVQPQQTITAKPLPKSLFVFIHFVYQGWSKRLVPETPSSKNTILLLSLSR